MIRFESDRTRSRKRDPVATSLKHSFKSGLPCEMPLAFLTYNNGFGDRYSGKLCLPTKLLL